MRKHCKYCGKELHEQASFCPYCMKSQIEKQRAILPEKKSKKWLYVLIIGLLLALLTVPVCILMHGSKELPDQNSAIPIETTESISTTSTEPIVTTISTTTANTEQTTMTTEPPTVAATETIPQETAFQLGDYLTEGKMRSQIQGYGGYEDMGGIVLTIEEITDTTLTFSIVQYDESGLASDTVSARNITAHLNDNTAEFEFRDMLDGRGTGRITLENGKIHIETFGDTNHPTSIIVNAYLTQSDY